jgi:hypothetical protein
LAFAFLLGLQFLGPAARPLAAQLKTRDTVARSDLYENGKKSPVLAASLSVPFALAGHLYLGNTRKGIAPTAVQLAGLLVANLTTRYSCMGVSCEDRVRASLAPAGLGLYLLGTIWGAATAYDEANEFNRKLQERWRIEPVTDGFGLRIMLPQ